MTPSFSVQHTTHFARLARKLGKGNADFRGVLAQAIEILESDTYVSIAGDC